jgi:hypothetical protein
MDELSAVQQLLAEPPPGPDAVEAARQRLERAAQGRTPLRTRAPGEGWHGPARARRALRSRHWPGWLAPVAAAAAVAGVIIASLGVSGLILRSAGSGPANSSGVFAKVPPYFVAIPEVSGRPVVVGATATGAVLGTVALPTPHTEFTWVAAAGDGRTFVLGASPKLHPGTSVPAPRLVKFYRLVLDRSGHPGRLEPLPIHLKKTIISGLALSPDGSKLAVSFLPVRRQIGSKIQVFSLTTGARQEWMWPGRGTIGSVVILAGSGGLQWEADNRTLMFEVMTRTTNGNEPAQLYLLDTAAPGGSLLASSTRIPVPSSELGRLHNNAKHRIIGMPLISGDGATLVAPFYHEAAPPKVFGFTITEFSVHTGKPTRVLYQRRTATEAASTGVWWVNTRATAMIVVRGPVFGVQTPTTFTPLPLRTQRLFVTRQGPMAGSLIRLPAW